MSALMNLTPRPCRARPDQVFRQNSFTCSARMRLVRPAVGHGLLAVVERDAGQIVNHTLQPSEIRDRKTGTRNGSPGLRLRGIEEKTGSLLHAPVPVPSRDDMSPCRGENFTASGPELLAAVGADGHGESSW